MDNEPLTPKKEKQSLAPCLSDHPNVSAKRIRFGNKGTVDFSSAEPVSSLTPQFARVLSSLLHHTRLIQTSKQVIQP